MKLIHTWPICMDIAQAIFGLTELDLATTQFETNNSQSPISQLHKIKIHVIAIPEWGTAHAT